MASPNLNIAHVAAAQNQKEVTINDAIDALDRAAGDALSVDFTAGNVTLTDAQFRGAVAFAAANLSAARDLTVPQIKRLFAVNNAAGSAALTVKRGTGTVEVAAGTAILAYTDGTANGLVALSAPAAEIPEPEAKTYLLAGASSGKPAGSARVFHHLAGLDFTLPAGLIGSAAKAKVAATAQADFDLQIGGASVGTIRWAAAGTVASFTSASGATVTAGDEIEILAPGTPDATLADLTWTIKGTA
jgi:hypothetical protein